MEIVGSLIPTFVSERRGKFDKFIHNISLSGINTMHLTSWSCTKYIYNILQI
jgi:hypothetical protein